MAVVIRKLTFTETSFVLKYQSPPHLIRVVGDSVLYIGNGCHILVPIRCKCACGYNGNISFSEIRLIAENVVGCDRLDANGDRRFVWSVPS
jgi:hypothetical protein